MPGSIILKSLVFGCLLAILPATGIWAKQLPKVGDRVESALTFRFPAPKSDEHTSYLKLPGNQEDVALQELDAAYFLIEIVGVYCPVCHTQAPDMVRLFQRIQRDADLSEKTVLIGVAAGGTPMEVEHLHRTWRFPFPILEDGDYSLHKLLGEPDTPFTFLVNREGEVLYAHLGRIDVNNVFNQLKMLP